jgi:hypothetical protein
LSNRVTPAVRALTSSSSIGFYWFHTIQVPSFPPDNQIHVAAPVLTALRRVNRAPVGPAPKYGIPRQTSFQGRSVYISPSRKAGSGYHSTQSAFRKSDISSASTILSGPILTSIAHDTTKPSDRSFHRGRVYPGGPVERTAAFRFLWCPPLLVPAAAEYHDLTIRGLSIDRSCIASAPVPLTLLRPPKINFATARKLYHLFSSRRAAELFCYQDNMRAF